MLLISPNIFPRRIIYFFEGETNVDIKSPCIILGVALASSQLWCGEPSYLDRVRCLSSKTTLSRYDSSLSFVIFRFPCSIRTCRSSWPLWPRDFRIARSPPRRFKQTNNNHPRSSKVSPYFCGIIYSQELLNYCVKKSMNYVRRVLSHAQFVLKWNSWWTNGLNKKRME